MNVIKKLGTMFGLECAPIYLSQGTKTNIKYS